MKAYLAVTGTIFALVAVLHVLRIFVEWRGLGPDLWFVGGTGAIGAALSAWALKLFGTLKQPR